MVLVISNIYYEIMLQYKLCSSFQLCGVTYYFYLKIWTAQLKRKLHYPCSEVCHPLETSIIEKKPDLFEFMYIVYFLLMTSLEY